MGTPQLAPSFFLTVHAHFEVCITTLESLQNVKTYTALHSPDILCILCEFTPTSEAQGCQTSIQEEIENQTSIKAVLNLAIAQNGASIEAFDCFSALPAGNYTVTVREIECTGGLGLREIIHHHVRVNGLPVDVDSDGMLLVMNVSAG